MLRLVSFLPKLDPTSIKGGLILYYYQITKTLQPWEYLYPSHHIFCSHSFPLAKAIQWIQSGSCVYPTQGYSVTVILPVAMADAWGQQLTKRQYSFWFLVLKHSSHGLLVPLCWTCGEAEDGGGKCVVEQTCSPCGGWEMMSKRREAGVPIPPSCNDLTSFHQALPPTVSPTSQQCKRLPPNL